jgi:diaminopimelate decarboxylase
MANAAALVAKVIDIVDTGRRGYKFLKVDAGMTELLRPAMYGAQHPIELIPATAGKPDYPERSCLLILFQISPAKRQQPALRQKTKFLA